MIAYGSRALPGPEKRYAATQLEALTLVWGVQHYRHYLAGGKIIVYTDHASLQFVFSNSEPSSKLQRWVASLIEYDFEVRYRPGQDNLANALSRLF